MSELKVPKKHCLKSALALAGLLVGSSVGCGGDRAPAGAFDEEGVWRLTYYDLDPKDQKDPEQPQTTARDAFLLKFDSAKGIVAASACGRSKSASHSVIDSNCDVTGSDKTRHFECSCFEYTFSGEEMRWKEIDGKRSFVFGADDMGVDTFAELRGEYADSDEDDDDKKKKDKNKKKKEDKKKEKDEEEEAEEESSSGEEEDGAEGHLIKVKEHNDKSATIIFTGLPNSTKEEDGGLFQSNGKTSKHTFEQRRLSIFKRTGCAKKCGIDD